MVRQTVYRYEERKSSAGAFMVGVNVNDEIGLDAYLDYTLQEHLEDLAGEGLTLVETVDDVHTFCDGSQRILQQREEDIDIEALDIATKLLLVASRLPAGTCGDKPNCLCPLWPLG